MPSPYHPRTPLLLATIMVITGTGTAVSEGGDLPATPPVDAVSSRDLAAPWEHWELDIETGPLWRATGSTSINYRLWANTVNLRSRAHLSLDFDSGAALRIRTTATLFAHGVAEGPESYFVGWSMSPSIEYWLPARKTHLFFNIGGGTAWTDSTEIDGGQGQDFLLNWFAKAGLRHQLTPSCSLSAGIFFQHLSNGGMADRNPGLDALGPVVGLSFRF